MAGGTMRARVPGIAAGAAMAQGPSDGRGSLQRQGFPPARPSLPDYIRCLVEMFTSLNGCVCRGRKKTHHGKKQKNCWRKTKTSKKSEPSFPPPSPNRKLLLLLKLDLINGIPCWERSSSSSTSDIFERIRSGTAAREITEFQWRLAFGMATILCTWNELRQRKKLDKRRVCVFFLLSEVFIVSLYKNGIGVS